MREGWGRAKAAVATPGIAVLLVALLAGAAAGAPTAIAPPAAEREIAAQAPPAGQAAPAAPVAPAALADAQVPQAAPAAQAAGPATDDEALSAESAPAAPSAPDAASAPPASADQSAPPARANDAAPSTGAQAPASTAPPAVPNASSPSIAPEQPAVAAADDDASASDVAAPGGAGQGAGASGGTSDGGRGGGRAAFAAQADATGRPPAPPAPDDGTILDIWRGPTDRLQVALTFDAGDDRGNGEAILDELAAQGVVATFGMTGRWAEANPDLVQRMVAEGHQLINHSWDHRSLTGASTGTEPMTYEQVLDEVTSTENLIRGLTGYELKPYFRPPFGDIGPVTSGYLAQAGYYVDVLWSCDSFGWNGFVADQIVEMCTSAEKGGPGAIILMHVGADAAGDLEALPLLIAAYRDQGYAFVTIEQMLQP